MPLPVCRAALAGILLLSTLAVGACENPPNGDQNARQITFNLAFDPIGCDNRGTTAWIAKETKLGAPPKRAIVSGTNQNGQDVTWTGPYNPATGVVTTNWYWVGNVGVFLDSGPAGNNSWGGTVGVGWVPPDGNKSYEIPWPGNPTWNQQMVAISCRGSLTKWNTTKIDKGPAFDPTCVGSGNPRGIGTNYEYWTGWSATTVDGHRDSSTTSIDGPAVVPNIHPTHATIIDCG